ncbi:MAG: AAA family ATPase [Pirellulales bacterium]|nr:AAA family ATPase [Pirellulales bacterium]
MTSRVQIEAVSQQVAAQLSEFVRRGRGLCLIKAPPGSGKTYTLMQAVAVAVAQGRRVAVATQTNAQADDICHRLSRDYRGTPVWRFAAADSAPPEGWPRTVSWITTARALPETAGVVIGTTAKWSLTPLTAAFDLLCVDEAWQMCWADFMLLQQVAPQFVLIGDPGQIPPVVAIKVHRWETSPRAPHLPAPELLLADPSVEKLALELPACRRLPADSVELVRPFYDFEFGAWAAPGERYLRVAGPGSGDPLDRLLGMLDEATAAIATLKTAPQGPPLEQDNQIADLAAALAQRALVRQAQVADTDDARPVPLQPQDIGISATHRVLNSAMLRALPDALQESPGGIRVDTPERWQGLERKLMIVVHPLSGISRPSEFDLETGRLCVMASRHRSALLIVTRDHVPQTLDRYMPRAEQAPGRPDVTGRGHWQHLQFWQTLAGGGRIVSCA